MFVRILFIFLLLSVPVFADDTDYNDPESYKDPDFYQNSDPNQWDYTKVDWDKVDLSRSEVYDSQGFYENLPTDKFSQIDYTQVDYTKVSDHSKIDSSKYLQDMQCSGCSLSGVDVQSGNFEYSANGLQHSFGNPADFVSIPGNYPVGSDFIVTETGFEVIVPSLVSEEVTGSPLETQQFTVPASDSVTINSEKPILVEYASASGTETMFFQGDVTFDENGAFVPKGKSARLSGSMEIIANENNVFVYTDNREHSGNFVQYKTGQVEIIGKSLSVDKEVVISGSGFIAQFDSFEGVSSSYLSPSSDIKQAGKNQVLSFAMRGAEVTLKATNDYFRNDEFPSPYITTKGNLFMQNGDSLYEITNGDLIETKHSMNQDFEPYFFTLDISEKTEHNWLFTENGNVYSGVITGHPPMILDQRGEIRLPYSFALSANEKREELSYFSNLRGSLGDDFEAGNFYFDDSAVEMLRNKDLSEPRLMLNLFSQRASLDYDEDYQDILRQTIASQDYSKWEAVDYAIFTTNVDNLEKYEEYGFSDEAFFDGWIDKISNGEALPKVISSSEHPERYSLDYYKVYSSVLSHADTDEERSMLLAQIGKGSNGNLERMPYHYLSPGESSNTGTLVELAIEYAPDYDSLSIALENLGYDTSSIDYSGKGVPKTDNAELQQIIDVKYMYDRKDYFKEDIETLGLDNQGVIDIFDAAIYNSKQQGGSRISISETQKLLDFYKEPKPIITTDMEVRMYTHENEDHFNWDAAAGLFEKAGMKTSVTSAENTRNVPKLVLADLANPDLENVLITTSNHGSPEKQHFKTTSLIKSNMHYEDVAKALVDRYELRQENGLEGFGNVHVHFESCYSSDYASNVVSELYKEISKRGYADVQASDFPQISSMAATNKLGWSTDSTFLIQTANELQKDGVMDTQDYRERIYPNQLENKMNPSIWMQVPEETTTGEMINGELIRISSNQQSTNPNIAIS